MTSTVKGFGHFPFGHAPFGTEDFVERFWGELPDQTREDDANLAEGRFHRFFASLKRSINFGDGMLQRITDLRRLRDPLQAPENVTTPRTVTVATGDGVTQTFTLALDYFPVVPGTAVLTLGGDSLTDDGSGVFSGALGEGVVSYTTGVLSFKCASVPAKGAILALAYTQLGNDPSLLARVAGNVGVTLDREEPVALQRRQASNARALFVVKGSDRGYKARGELSGFFVRPVQLWQLNGPPTEFLIQNNAVEVISSVSYTALAPRYPRFDEVPGDLIQLDKIEAEYGDDPWADIALTPQYVQGTLVGTTFTAPYVARPLSGQVTMTNGSPTVTGTGTHFTAQLAPGQYIAVSQNPFVFGFILSITDDETLTMSTNFPGSTRTGAPVSLTTLDQVVPDPALYPRSVLRLGNVDLRILERTAFTVTVEEHGLPDGAYNWTVGYTPRFYDGSDDYWAGTARLKLLFYVGEIGDYSVDVAGLLTKLKTKILDMVPAHVRVIAMETSVDAISNAPVIV